MRWPEYRTEWVDRQATEKNTKVIYDGEVEIREAVKRMLSLNCDGMTRVSTDDNVYLPCVIML